MDIVSLIFRATTKELDDASKKLDTVASKSKKAEKGAGGLKSAFGELKGVGGPIGDVASQVEGLQGKVTAATRAAVLLGPALVAVAGAAGILASLRFVGVLDDLGDLALKLGLSTTQASLLKQEMDDAGVSVQAYQKGVDRVAKALGMASDAGSETAKAFKILGVNAKTAGEPQELLNELTTKYSEKLKEGTISTREMAELQKVLGENYREVIIAAEANAAAQKRYNEFMQHGIGFSQQSQKATSDFSSANKDLQFVLQVVGSQLVSEIVPAFTGLINALVDSYKNGGLVAIAFDAIRVASQIVMVPIRALFNIFIQLDAAIQSVGKSIGALFAAIATRSLDPFKMLKEDLAKIWETANSRTTGPYSWDGGPKEAAQSNNVNPNIGPGKASTSTGDDAAYKQLLAEARARADAKNKEYEDINKWIAQNKLDEYNAAHQALVDEDKRIAKIKERYDAEVLAWEQQKTIEEQRKAYLADWRNGMMFAIEEYINASANAAQQTADLFTKAFNGMDDALVQFAMTGKLNFKSLAASIISDLIRIQIKAAISGIFSFLSGAPAGPVGFASVAGISGGRAAGGPVEAGKNYVVGEKGPEILRMGSTSGSIVPNHAISGGGGSVQTNYITVTVQGGKDAKETGQTVSTEILKIMKGVAKQEIAAAKKQAAYAV